MCVSLSLPLCRRICGVHNWSEPHHGVLIIERGRSAQSHVVRCKCLRSPWDQRVARRDQALPCGIQSTGLPGRYRCRHAHHLLVLQVRSRSTPSSSAMRNGVLVVVLLLLKLAKQASKVLVRFLLPSSGLSDSFVCLLLFSFFLQHEEQLHFQLGDDGPTHSLRALHHRSRFCQRRCAKSDDRSSISRRSRRNRFRQRRRGRRGFCAVRNARDLQWSSDSVLQLHWL